MRTDLIEVKELFDKIANTSGKNDKIKIIKQNKDNELFIECLKFLLDSDIVTGLSKKKIKKRVAVMGYRLETMEEAMEYLKHHNSGRDSDIAMIKDFCDRQEGCKIFCEELFTKSLKIGIDVK